MSSLRSLSQWCMELDHQRRQCTAFTWYRSLTSCGGRLQQVVNKPCAVDLFERECDRSLSCIAVLRCLGAGHQNDTRLYRVRGVSKLLKRVNSDSLRVWSRDRFPWDDVCIGLELLVEAVSNESFQVGINASNGTGTHLMPYYVVLHLSLIHISEPTSLGMLSYAVSCLK